MVDLAIFPQKQTVSIRQAIAVLLLASTLVLGGGGTPSPLPETLLEFITVMMVAMWVGHAPQDSSAKVPPAAWWIAGAVLVLPMAQLVPLPPSLWHALPGRNLEQSALGLVGATDSWRPWSMTPDRTLASILAIVPPVVVMLMAASLDTKGRQLLVATVAAAAAVSMLVGGAQIRGGLFLFYNDTASDLVGFQANRNSTADVLLIGMMAFAAALREWSDRRRNGLTYQRFVIICACATVIFALGVFLTGSRTGIALLLPAFTAVAAIAWPKNGLALKGLGMGLAGVSAAGLMGAVFLRHSLLVTNIIGRFQQAGELRPQLWLDGLFAARQYFPFGSGVGSFVPSFIAAERLEIVRVTMPNRAHNDFLELAIEGGAFGLLLLALLVVFLAVLFARALRQPAASRVQVLFAGATLCIFSAHSALDYPIRSMSLACVAGLCAALLLPSTRPARWLAAQNLDDRK